MLDFFEPSLYRNQTKPVLSISDFKDDLNIQNIAFGANSTITVKWDCCFEKGEQSIRDKQPRAVSLPSNHRSQQIHLLVVIVRCSYGSTPPSSSFQGAVPLSYAICLLILEIFTISQQRRSQVFTSKQKMRSGQEVHCVIISRLRRQVTRQIIVRHKKARREVWISPAQVLFPTRDTQRTAIKLTVEKRTELQRFGYCVDSKIPFSFPEMGCEIRNCSLSPTRMSCESIYSSDWQTARQTHRSWSNLNGARTSIQYHARYTNDALQRQRPCLLLRAFSSYWRTTV